MLTREALQSRPVYVPRRDVLECLHLRTSTFSSWCTLAKHEETELEHSTKATTKRPTVSFLKEYSRYRSMQEDDKEMVATLKSPNASDMLMASADV